MQGHTEVLHALLKAGADATRRVGKTADQTGYVHPAFSQPGTHGVGSDPSLHVAALFNHMDVVRILAERWPTSMGAWWMFVMGAGAKSELRDYQAPPLNQVTRNFLPRLYEVPDVMRFIFSFLHKPRYVSVSQVNSNGQTALQMMRSPRGAMQKMRYQVPSRAKNAAERAAQNEMEALLARLATAEGEVVGYICAGCGSPGATKRCTRCRSVHFCDKECLRAGWKTHKKACKALAVAADAAGNGGGGEGKK